MAVIGGSVESVNIAGRNFGVPADTEVQIKLGGFENETQSNGNGSVRQIKTRVPAVLSGLMVEIDDDRGDHEFLQGLSDGSDYYPVNITLVNGKTFSGDLQIEGEFQRSTQSTTASLDMSGSSISQQ